MPSQVVEDLLMSLLELPDDLPDLVLVLADAMEDEGMKFSGVLRGCKIPDIWACPECGGPLGAMNGGLPTTCRVTSGAKGMIYEIPRERRMLQCGGLGPTDPCNPFNYRRRCSFIISKETAKNAARQKWVERIIKMAMGWK